MIPDRNPDTRSPATKVPAVADEIRNQNIIRVFPDGNAWLALVGPDPVLGLMGSGATPEAALWNLVDRIVRLGWTFDPSWRPSERPTNHDA